MEVSFAGKIESISIRAMASMAMLNNQRVFNLDVARMRQGVSMNLYSFSS